MRKSLPLRERLGVDSAYFDQEEEEIAHEREGASESASYLQGRRREKRARRKWTQQENNEFNAMITGGLPQSVILSVFDLSVGQYNDKVRTEREKVLF